jgi:hypothetical protein
LSALTDLSRVPGLTGEEFRRVLLQTETMRVTTVNEGRIPGSTSGARATVVRGYDIATDRIEECVRDFFVRPVGRVAAPSVPPTHHTQPVKLLESVGDSPGRGREIEMVSLPWLGRKGPKMLDFPGVWGRSIWVGTFARKTSTTRRRGEM